MIYPATWRVQPTLSLWIPVNKRLGFIGMTNTTKRNPTDTGYDTFFSIEVADEINVQPVTGEGWWCVTSQDCAGGGGAAIVRTRLETHAGLGLGGGINPASGRLNAGATFFALISNWGMPVGILPALAQKHAWPGWQQPEYTGGVRVTWGNMLCDEVAGLASVDYEIRGTPGWIEAGQNMSGIVRVGMPNNPATGYYYDTGLLPTMLYHQDRFADVKNNLVGKELVLYPGTDEVQFQILTASDSVLYVATTGRRSIQDTTSRWNDIAVSGYWDVPEDAWGIAQIGAIDCDHENFQQ